ncbi:MAG: helix-hairpin-helix domain-containing protein [Promethearchaeota archaeon]
MQVANSIGKSTVERMKQIGIDSVEKLASSRVENLLAIDGIGLSKAKNYILLAKNYIKNIKAKEKITSIIKQARTSNDSKSTEMETILKPHEKISSCKAPISSIKKLASTSVDHLSKIKGMSPSEAQRYIEIAKKYLERMRNEEILINKFSSKSTSQNQALGFVKFEDNLNIKNLKQLTPPKQKQEPSLKRPQLSINSLKKPILDKNLLEKSKYKKPVKAKSTNVEQVKLDTKKPSVLKPFFHPNTMQKIRLLHFKIKKLEERLARNENFTFSELNDVIEYIKILNVNYKTQSQIKIFKELEITPSFYDHVAKREIQIWDLIFECARVLWISAQAYSYLSTKFEEQNLMENAIVAMVECSKMYKTAAYFSAACTRQEDKGIILSVENLEMDSEEARILAQNLATLSEEQKGNYSMAANLSAGLSALSKRLAFLRKYDDKKEKHFKAQYNYDIGRACHLIAKSLLKLSPKGENEEKIEKLQKKANYYYLKAEEIWESMINQSEKLSDSEIKAIKNNLSVVNEKIIENDVEIISEKEALEIQDPEPLIIIPENLAPFLPRTTNFLTKYKQTDLNFDAYLRYKNLMSDVLIDFNKIQELRNNKAGIGRTLKQLKILYDNNDIDINSFTELYEKYSIKLEAIEAAIQNLNKPKNKTKITEDQKEVLKTIM